MTSFICCRKKTRGTAVYKAKSLPVYVRFPRLVVVEIGASEHISPRRSTTYVAGTRESMTFFRFTRGGVSSSSLPVSMSFIIIYLPLGYCVLVAIATARVARPT